MDPNQALEDIRSAAREADYALHDISRLLAYARMAEHFEALDQWLSKGGFLPDAWSQQ